MTDAPNTTAEKYRELIGAIAETNERNRHRPVKRVLLVYDLNRFFIGDTCVNVSRLKKIKRFYNDAQIDINTVDAKHHSLVHAIIANNPYVSSYTNYSWVKVDWEQYDVIISACIPEQDFLVFLDAEFRTAILDGNFHAQVFSAAGNVGFEDRFETLLPINEDFIGYHLPEEENSSMMSNELFLRHDEERWSNKWFRDKGLKRGDELVVMLDSSSNQEKVLTQEVYSGLISWFLKEMGERLLVFDENCADKKKYYEEMLGEKISGEIIFAEGLGLREAISLLGNNRFVKMIIGPSTGLLHCASGVYNVRLQNGKVSGRIPVMIGYLGKVANVNYHEDLWWNKSLVDAILVMRSEEGNNTIRSIRDVDFEQLQKDDAFLPCRDFTTGLLKNYLAEQYSDRLKIQV